MNIKFKTKKVRKYWILDLEYKFSRSFKILVKFLFGSAITIGAFLATINYGGIEDKLPFTDENLTNFNLELSNERNRIDIPKLNLLGKVSYNVEENNQESLLKESVIHLNGSALPGEKGNSIFTAHSSNYFLGHYSNIFSRINRLELGDDVYVYKEGKRFNYSVKEKSTILPTELDKLPQNGSTLSLVTCWPLGTDLKRLVVIAEYVN